MKLDKSKLLGVHVIAEIDATELFEDPDVLEFVWNYASVSGNQVPWFAFYLGGTPEQFANIIDKYAHWNTRHMKPHKCPQILFDYFKYAHELGAKWVMFKAEYGYVR